MTDIVTRVETPADFAAIHQIVEQAFGQPDGSAFRVSSLHRRRGYLAQPH